MRYLDPAAQSRAMPREREHPRRHLQRGPVFARAEVTDGRVVRAAHRTQTLRWKGKGLKSSPRYGQPSRATEVSSRGNLGSIPRYMHRTSSIPNISFA
jgi:hypothetical protein